jgi:hypothetical protein
MTCSLIGELGCAQRAFFSNKFSIVPVLFVYVVLYGCGSSLQAAVLLSVVDVQFSDP